MITVENEWSCFRIAEDAAFEKYGMIAFLTRIIASEKTGVLVVATYDTDYLFIKKGKFDSVKKSLINNGCSFI
ncbi:ACT domain-containing protein [Enterocloster clostridioformis]|uniref:ACT domain-containing protein n=1 Tax=Enterocloster clostridioformis TaxID=1531 RepID=UPI002A7F3736|nr:ACT domain-containing protein [Enterocloster clostridioformis]MCF2703595.1 ACT domain-containing protein [Enterocloster clostridioformis]